MKNIELREMMIKLYRLVEKYENPPKIQYTDEAEKFFQKAVTECTVIYNQYNNPYAKRLIVAFYEALGDTFKATNKLPLEDRPEQISL